MFKILYKKELNENVTMMKIDAPLIAKKAKAGQFIIFRIDEFGERIPLTIADYDRKEGSITIIFQKIGYSTKLLGSLNQGDYILDFIGPLGNASQLDNIKNALVIGGGLGCAICYPQAKSLYGNGSKVDIIAGFKTKELIILEKEMLKISNNLHICTDDGSYGYKGFVTDKLEDLINCGKKYDTVFVVGPLVMMKSVCEITKKYNIKTIVSMNPIMIDGTGMCGGCRLTVDGKTRFACVDGPEFDGHLVDFDEAINRSVMFRHSEQKEKEKECRLFKRGIENA